MDLFEMSFYFEKPDSQTPLNYWFIYPCNRNWKFNIKKPGLFEYIGRAYRALSRFQTHGFVFANQHEDPAQQQEGNDLDRGRRRGFLKCLKMQFAGLSAEEPGCINPEDVSDQFVTTGNFFRHFQL